MGIGHLALAFALCFEWYVAGVTQFEQLVAYPLFGRVGEPDYVAYHLDYSRRIPLPVIVPGFASFLLPFLLLALKPTGVPWGLAAANALMGLAGLAVTVALEIPRHARLERGGKDTRTIRELILFNWPRTASITASAVLTTAMARHAFAPA